MALHQEKAASTCNIYTTQDLLHHHRVYSNIYTNIIIDTIHAPTRRSYTLPTCLLR